MMLVKRMMNGGVWGEGFGKSSSEYLMLWLVWRCLLKTITYSCGSHFPIYIDCRREKIHLEKRHRRRTSCQGNILRDISASTRTNVEDQNELLTNGLPYVTFQLHDHHEYDIMLCRNSIYCQPPMGESTQSNPLDIKISSWRIRAKEFIQLSGELDLNYTAEGISFRPEQGITSGTE